MRAGQTFASARENAVTGLDDADRRLAHEIAAGVLRHRVELDSRLEPLFTGDWRGAPADLKDVLRIGAYQLTHLTRVPPYAAVQTAVALAKERLGQRPAGLVNAVLRRLAREGEARTVTPPSTSLADRHSHPAWLVERWVARYGSERTEALLRHNNHVPPLTIQPARWSVEALRRALEEHGVTAQPAPGGQGFSVTGTRVGELPGYHEGAFVVQDAAQARLLRFAAIPDGALVWDACASPGGKAALLAPRCRVIASDLRRERLPKLLDTLRRVAAGIPVAAADARYPPFPWATFDVVLLDVPCSATGTMARHPDARWQLSAHRLRRLIQTQAALLRGASKTVRSGGLLVYLTCSLEPEENAEQVDRLLAGSPQFTREGDDLYIFPPEAGTDGGYGARLRMQP